MTPAAPAIRCHGLRLRARLPDDLEAVPRDAMLAHVREIVAATPLPVNADFQSGYAREPAAVAVNVGAVRRRPASPGSPSRTRPAIPRRRSTSAQLAVERIRAARAAIDDDRQRGSAHRALRGLSRRAPRSAGAPRSIAWSPTPTRAPSACTRPVSATRRTSRRS